MSSYFKHKLEFELRKRCLAIINQQFGVTDEDNILLDMIVDPDEGEGDKPKASGFYSSFYRYMQGPMLWASECNRCAESGRLP